MATQTEYQSLPARILARVKDKPGETPRDLASYLEADYNSVTRALSRLNQRDSLFAIDGQYFPIYGDMDEMVARAFHLEKVKFTPVPAWRRWWRRLGRLAGAPWLGIPATIYAVAAMLGYGIGRWLT
jgi:hypothetical protein